MKPAVENAANESQVKSADNRNKSEREQHLNDVRFILSNPQGRRFLWKQLAVCDRISAQASGSLTYFAEGERNAALKIKADIVEASPEAFLQMMKENKGD